MSYVIQAYIYKPYYLVNCILNNNLMNDRMFYVRFNTLLGYIRTATSKGMK